MKTIQDLFNAWASYAVDYTLEVSSDTTAEDISDIYHQAQEFAKLNNCTMPVYLQSQFERFCS
jgi:S-methylmethionine-dependent homocysteine/selenocysteine methylase